MGLCGPAQRNRDRSWEVCRLAKLPPRWLDISRSRQPPAQACYRRFQMQPSESKHIGAATLEKYSLQKLDLEAGERVECHLPVCGACRAQLAEIEPFSTIHNTQDGPFYSRVTQLRNGSFFARHWGCQIDGGGRHPDLASASKYLLDSFIQMFPEHDCRKGCVAPKERAHG